jgi:hypothetical protein
LTLVTSRNHFHAHNKSLRTSSVSKFLMYLPCLNNVGLCRLRLQDSTSIEFRNIFYVSDVCRVLIRCMNSTRKCSIFCVTRHTVPELSNLQFGNNLLLLKYS